MFVLLNGLQAGNRSGTGTYTVELARRLPGLDPDITVRVIWPSNTPIPEGADASAFILTPPRGFASRILYDQFSLPREARSLGADLIHYPANIGGVFPGHPSIVTVHDLSFRVNPSWFTFDRAQYYQRGVARSVCHAKRVIAVSNTTARDLRLLLSVPEDKLDVVHNGVDERFSHPIEEDARRRVREQYILPERFILYMGTLEPRKNLVRVIQAYSTIARECPCDLVIAGREGWKTEGIREAAEASGIRERIHFPGFILDEDLPALTTLAEVFIYVSLYEGFGLPILNAMAAGVPVITSDNSCLPEIAGGAALLVDPTCVGAIAGAMMMACHDKALRDRLIAEGPVRAGAFTWRRAALSTLNSYRRAMLS